MNSVCFLALFTINEHLRFALCYNKTGLLYSFISMLYKYVLYNRMGYEWVIEKVRMQ